MSRPGFYTVPGTSLVSDVLMLAGGPSSSSNINSIEFRRMGAPIGVPRHVVWQSMSIDDLGVQSGDEMLLHFGSRIRWVKQPQMQVGQTAQI